MIQWDVSPILVEFGAVKIRWYGLMFVMGFSGGLHLMRWVCKREGKDPEAMENLLIYMILGTTIGARLGHCLFYDPVYYLSNPLKILYIWEGGLASHGGTAGVILSVYLFLRKTKDFNFVWLLDRLSMPAAMTATFIRIGNLMNSEILGKPTDGTWGIVFSKVDSIPRHPAQLYESASYFLIFVSLFCIYKFTSLRLKAGFMFGFGIGSIFLARIFIEFFKENQEAFEQGMLLNMGQLLSIPFVMICYYMAYRAWRAPDSMASKGKKVRS